jgi:hypothetical protein
VSLRLPTNYRIERAASRNAPWAPAHIPRGVRALLDTAAEAESSTLVRFFLALFLLRPSGYRLLLEEDGLVASTVRHGSPSHRPRGDVFAMRIWHEVRAVPGSFLPRVDPATSLALANCTTFENALTAANTIALPHGVDGQRLSARVVQICPIRRTMVQQRELPGRA